MSQRWMATDAATAQSDRNEGSRAAADRAEPSGALDRYWRRLTAEGAGDLLRLYGECSRVLEDQNARRERLRQEHDTEMVGQGTANQRQHDDRLATLKRELGPEAPVYRQLAARAEDTQKTLRSIRGEVNSRPLRTQFVAFYPVGMLLLALAEVPVNRAAFELTFREEPVFSVLVAAGVGIAVIFFAHWVGLTLRRWPRRPTLATVAPRIGGLAVVLAAVGAGIYFMARMRQAFMRLVSAESEGFAQRLQEALRGGAREAVSVMVEQPMTIGDWTFLAINVLLFLFGVVASFLRHDPHPDYEKAVRDAARAERAFAAAEKRYGDKVAAETARFEDRKRALDGQIGELQASLSALSDQSAGVREHCLSNRQMVAQAIRTRCGSFIEGYGGAAGRAGIAAKPPETQAILRELPLPGGFRED